MMTGPTRATAAGLATRVVQGAAIEPHIERLARLRIEIFRAWPYLYDGSQDYEQRYLGGYTRAPLATIVLAEAEGQIVGLSTAMPIEAHGPDVAGPVAAAGYDLAKVFYFGESVLLPQWRGYGLGRVFFAARERAARAAGFAWATFCAVERPDSHPARPASYVPLDGLWKRVGFSPSDVMGSLAWRDVGDANETRKPMRFWFKALR